MFFLHFLNNKEKQLTYIYSYRVCYTFIVIFEFHLIYLLYVLFVLKVDDNFRKRKSQSENARTYYFLYI